MLDAVHYLCLGKSYFHSSDLNSVKHEEFFFRIEGNFETPENLDLVCTFQAGNKKELAKNGVTYPRLIDHVGVVPVVMITPDDQLLIDETSEERRRFIDNTISQIDHPYLETLISYNKILQQRNASLKQFALRGAVNRQLIESYDDQLIDYGTKIFSWREKYFNLMIPFIEIHYKNLSENAESVSASYISICKKENFKEALQKSFQKDIDSQRTNEGIHRDDFDFYLNERSLKKFGSQGQKKSFLMALKLSQYELIRKQREINPLLLLDDLFDKLDEARAANILSLVSANGFGQVFITDTNEMRIENFIAETGIEANHLKIGRLIAASS